MSAAPRTQWRRPAAGANTGNLPASLTVFRTGAPDSPVPLLDASGVYSIGRPAVLATLLHPAGCHFYFYSYVAGSAIVAKTINVAAEANPAGGLTSTRDSIRGRP